MIVRLEDLPHSGGAHRFVGADHGGLPVSLILIQAEPGSGPTSPHRHPYPELWLVEQGAARFTIGEQEVDASAGELVIGPAEVPHRFTNTGDGPLRIVSIHPAARLVVEESVDAGG
jgi:mannose-6-phosphate isomerase-like protein (cupin superfamily)